VAGNRFLVNGYCVSQGYRVKIIGPSGMLVSPSSCRERIGSRKVASTELYNFDPRFDLGLFRHEAGAVICGFTRKYWVFYHGCGFAVEVMWVSWIRAVRLPCGSDDKGAFTSHTAVGQISTQ
jgi:hypothetical protein